MRAFAFLAVVLLTASLAFAQNVFHPVEELKSGIFGALVGGGNYTFNNSMFVVDKLGIGTTAPNATLDVNGSVAVPNEGSGGYYTAKNAAGTSKIILSVSNNGMASDATRIRSAGGGISLEDSSANTLVSILNGGNVGIGTASVSSNRLHIVGGSLSVNPTGAAEHHAVGGISIIHGGSSFPNRVLQIAPATDNNPSYVIQAARSSGSAYWWTYGVNTDNSFHISRGADSITGSDFVIDSSGNVHTAGTVYASSFSGGNAIPSGMIALFNSACPSGWTRFTSLDNAFPQGAATAGGSGTTGSHSHTYVIAASGYRNGDVATSAASNIPYYNVVYCTKN